MSTIDSVAKRNRSLDSTDANVIRKAQDQIEPGSAGQSKSDVTLPDKSTVSETSVTSTPVVAVKAKILGWKSPAEVKRLKSALAHSNMFDVLATPKGTIPEETPSSKGTDVGSAVPSEGENPQSQKNDCHSGG